MSLNLTIINSSGAWQCSDHRLSDPRSAKPTEDTSSKHVVLRCTDGTALIAYVGLGKVDGVALSDWIRELLRGEPRSVDQSLMTIREAATIDLGPIVSRYRLHHMFTVAAFIQRRPWLAQIRNFSVAPGKFGDPTGTFETAAGDAANGLASAFPVGFLLPE